MSDSGRQRIRMWGVLFADSWQLALMPRFLKQTAYRDAAKLAKQRDIPLVVRTVTVLLPKRPKRRSP